MAITLGLVEAVDSNGVYVSMPGSRGVLRGPYRSLSTAGVGTTVLIAATEDGEQVVVGPTYGGDGFYNVRTFGAAGDGVTDDTAAVHAARDAAGDGGTVYFPSGTYRMTATLNVENQTWAFAAGVECRCASTSSALITITASGVEVRGGTLVGDWDWDAYVGQDVAPRITGNKGIRVEAPASTAVSNVTVRGVTFRRFGHAAFETFVQAGGTLDGTSLIDCTIVENRTGATWWCETAGSQNNRILVRGCTFEDTWMPATRGDAAYGGNFLGTVTGTGGTITDMTVEGNHFGDRCGRMVLEVWAKSEPYWVTNLRVVGNRFGEGWYRTISLGAYGAYFANNEVNDFYSYVETGGDHYVFDSNVFYGAYLWPVSNTFGAVVQRNVFHLVDNTFAIKAWYVGDWSIVDNEFYFRDDVRGVTEADVPAGRKGDVVAVSNCSRFTVARNTFRFQGKAGAKHWLNLNGVALSTFSDNLWHVTRSATADGQPSDNGRVLFEDIADCAITGNRVTSDIELDTASQCHVSFTHETSSVVRRSWDTGTGAWVDKTLDGILNTPPGSPASGDEYLVGDTPTGAWGGHPGEFAEWSGAAWTFRSVDGWVFANPATPDSDDAWIDTTPSTGSAGSDLALLSGTLRNTFSGNDWTGAGAGFALSSSRLYYRRSGGVYVDNVYDGAVTAYGGVNPTAVFD